MITSDDHNLNQNDHVATEDAPATEQIQHTQEPNYKDLFQRTTADFQNYKRRIERERVDWAHMIQSETIEKVLTVVDDLERAIQAAHNSPQADNTAWIEGFDLILKNFKKKLAELGVEEVPATGEFNPEFHEALMHVDSPEHQSNQIVQILSRGYSLKGKVITHARVSVAR
jgi:molecular chaperone GrpE